MISVKIQKKHLCVSFFDTYFLQCITFTEILTPTSGVHYLRFIKGDRSFTGIGKFYSYPYNGYQDVSLGNDSLSGEFSVCGYIDLFKIFISFYIPR